MLFEPGFVYRLNILCCLRWIQKAHVYRELKRGKDKKKKRKRVVVVRWRRPKLTEYSFDHQEPFFPTHHY